MNKVICPECGKKIEANIKQCNECGFKIHNYTKVIKVIKEDEIFILESEEKKIKRINYILGVFIIIFIFSLIYFTSDYDIETIGILSFSLFYSFTSFIAIGIINSPLAELKRNINYNNHNKFDKEDKKQIKNVLEGSGLINTEQFDWSIYNGSEKLNYSIYTDDENKKLAITLKQTQSTFDTDNQTKLLYNLNYEDILEFDVIEDNSTILKGGIGRAFVGGALAGGAGAIVGATTRKNKNIVTVLYMRIITKQKDNKYIKLNFLDKSIDNKPIERDGYLYKWSIEYINQVYSILSNIVRQNKENDITSKELSKSSNNNIEEKLIKLQNLLDKKLITKTEYTKKKNEILENL